jgi:hypothetical protein
MKELLDLVAYAERYASAIQRGFDKFVASYPVILQQQLKSIATRKLHTTKQQYLDAIQSKMQEEYVLVIELDKDAWLANALEKGCSPFDMKEGHLKSPKAKISKEGFRYRVIPISKDKSGGSASSNPKSQALKQKIQDVLIKPKFAFRKLKLHMDGSVSTSEAVKTNDPDIKGLYRIRHYKTPALAEAKQGSTSYVMFRVMSEKPGSAEWMHPGLPGVNCFRDLDLFINQTFGPMMVDMIQAEISKI